MEFTWNWAIFSLHTVIVEQLNLICWSNNESKPENKHKQYSVSQQERDDGDLAAGSCNGERKHSKHSKIELFLGWSQHWMWYWWWGWLLDRSSTWLQVFLLILPCLNISRASQCSQEENKYIYNETSVQHSPTLGFLLPIPATGRIISSELIKVWGRHSHR